MEPDVDEPDARERRLEAVRDALRPPEPAPRRGIAELLAAIRRVGLDRAGGG